MTSNLKQRRNAVERTTRTMAKQQQQLTRPQLVSSKMVQSPGEMGPDEIQAAMGLEMDQAVPLGTGMKTPRERQKEILAANLAPAAPPKRDPTVPQPAPAPTLSRDEIQEMITGAIQGAVAQLATASVSEPPATPSSEVEKGLPKPTKTPTKTPLATEPPEVEERELSEPEAGPGLVVREYDDENWEEEAPRGPSKDDVVLDKVMTYLESKNMIRYWSNCALAGAVSGRHLAYSGWDGKLKKAFQDEMDRKLMNREHVGRVLRMARSTMNTAHVAGENILGQFVALLTAGQVLVQCSEAWDE